MLERACTFLAFAALLTMSAACKQEARPPPPGPSASAAAASSFSLSSAAPAPAKNDVPVPNKRMKKFADLNSGHAEGAADAPSPLLILTRNARCFKSWQNHGTSAKGAVELTITGHTYTSLIMPGAEVVHPKNATEPVRIICPKATNQVLASYLGGKVMTTPPKASAGPKLNVNKVH